MKYAIAKRNKDTGEVNLIAYDYRGVAKKGNYAALTRGIFSYGLWSRETAEKYREKLHRHVNKCNFSVEVITADEAYKIALEVCGGKIETYVIEDEEEGKYFAGTQWSPYLEDAKRYVLAVDVNRDVRKFKSRGIKCRKRWIFARG